MAGLRFGYALAHPVLAREIAKGKMPYNVNAVTLVAAEEVLADDRMLAERVAAIVAERERTVAALVDLPGLEVYPSQANFFVIRCRTVAAREVFSRMHQEFGILVRDIAGAPPLEECLRISVGTAEDMDAVLAALRAIFRTRAREDA